MLRFSPLDHNIIELFCLSKQCINKYAVIGSMKKHLISRKATSKILTDLFINSSCKTFVVHKVS